MKSLVVFVLGILLPSVGLTETFELNYAEAVTPLSRRARQAVSLDEGTLRQLGIPTECAPKVNGTLVVGDRLMLRLFDDFDVELELTERLKDVFAAESFIASAVVGGQTNRAAVVRTADGLQISIADPRTGRTYTVMTSPDGAVVREIDSQAGVRRPLPPRRPKRPNVSAKRAKAAKSVIAAGETLVDLLVAYDKGAKSWVADEGGVTNFALAAVAKMNVALANTGLDACFRFRLVGVTTVEAKSTDVSVALDKVTEGDAGWESIAAVRAETGADIVSVLIDTGSAYGTTGIGWSLESGDGDYSWFAPNAYNACAIRAVAQSHTMTHEVGHNMGAGHSDRQADSPGPQLFPYSSGFYFQAGGKNYHTIMAYESDGASSTRYAEIPYFSSPAYAYEGVTVGDADHDNTQTLANTFYQVASFMTREDEGTGDGEAQVGSFVFDYTVCDGEASISAVRPADARQGTKLVIPAFLDGYPVTYLGYSMLDGCPGIKSVVIPDTVVELGGTFCCYHSLEEVDLGKGVRSIGGDAFWSCNLKKIHLPASVESIGYGGIGGCSLTGAFGEETVVPAITVDPENPHYAARDGALYDKNLTELLCCPVSAATVVLPETVECIDDQAFYLNPHVQCVKIPAAVSSVDADAFFRCPLLTAIDVDPENPHYASVDGVLYDKAVAELVCVPYGKRIFTLPASVSALRLGRYEDRNVFSYYSQNLTDIFVEEGNPAFSSYDGALYDKSGRTLLHIPQGKTSLTLSPTVVDLGDRENIFDNLSLEHLGVATGNTTFATDAAGILYDARFENLLMAPKKIKSAVLPAGLKSIGANAFYGCGDLRSVICGGAVDLIETDAFGGCVRLTSVQGMESVREVGEYAFWCCYQLKNLASLDKAEVIGEGAFYLCKVLPSVTIGRELKSLGERAFYGCESLRRVDFLGNAPEVVFSSYWSDDYGPFLDTPEDLRVCVADGSLGWDGDPQSSELPEKWPVGDPNARTITHQVYGISYDLAGGANVEENPVEYAAAQLPLTLKTPMRDGCSFEGWLLDGQVVTEIPRGTVGDLVLTAKWGAFGPGVWTTNVSAAKKVAARDGALICVVYANYAGCYYSQLFWPNLTGSAFLAWARESGVYLVNADGSFDLGGTGSTDAAEEWFFTLYRNWPETDGCVYFPTVAVVYPEAVNAPIGLDVFRPGETVGGGYYDGSADSLIECLSSYVDNKPAAAVSVPDVADRYALGQDLVIPVLISGVTKPRVTVSGLPRGVSYANGRLAGKPSVAGVFAVTVKADFGGGVVRETAFSIVVYDPDGCFVKVDFDAARGSVTGAGAYKRGKKATLKATAKKGFVFAGWRNAEGRLIAQGPSFSFAVEQDEEVLSAEFIPVEEDWATVDCVTEAGSVRVVTNETKVVLAPIAVAAAGGSLPTVKVAGLPSGLKFTAKDVLKKGSKTEVDIPANTIYGTPTKGGVYNATVTVTTAGKASVLRAIKFVIRTASDYVVDADWDPAQGKVTGVGIVKPGKKVTLKATANKGYAFNGWYEGEGSEGLGGLVTQAASYSFTMPSEDVAYVARFVTVEEDKASIKASVNGMDLSGTSGETPLPRCETNVWAGVYLEWPVAASALSQPTVKVSGLPSGLKFTAKPVTTKVTSGTGAAKVTTVVTNVPANTIYGAPTAASKADKTGKATPSKVKVTVTTAGKSKAVYEIALTVDPLPSQASGAFAGLALTRIREEGIVTATRWGSASMTVGATGKISGKVIVNGTNCTFTAASYDSFKKGESEDGWLASAVCSLKIGKQVVPMELTVVAGGAFVEKDDLTVDLFRNSWKDKGAEPVPEEYQGTYSAKLANDVFRTGYLSLTVGKDGKVKVSGKAPDGTAFSATATLVPSVGPDGAAYFFMEFFAAPSAYKGGYLAGTVNFLADRTLSGYVEWRSFNPQSTADYYAGGFNRGLDVTGACYVKADAPKKLGVADVRLEAPVGATLSAFSFTQSTGIWKGTLLWNFGDPSLKPAKIPFEGILVQGEGLEGFGTYDVQSSYVPYDKQGNPQKVKSYKYKKSVPVGFGRE